MAGPPTSSTHGPPERGPPWRWKGTFSIGEASRSGRPTSPAPKPSSCTTRARPRSGRCWWSAGSCARTCTTASRPATTSSPARAPEGASQSFFLDTYYASKLGAAPTTGASSNLVFSAGTRDLAGLCAAMGTGILVTGFSGGNSNSATGDFSVGIRGQWVEGGKPVRAVSEMNLSGNALELWGKLLELGSDPYVYASNRCPSLRFDEVQFSGV